MIISCPASAPKNLLTNSIKYIDKPNGEISVGHQDDGDFYKFYVKDNGAGILKADRQRIFNLIETAGHTSNRDTSTGVGLNIMKMHVEEQGGKSLSNPLLAKAVLFISSGKNKWFKV